MMTEKGALDLTEANVPQIFRSLEKIKPLYDWTYKVLMFICKILLIGDILITCWSVAGRYIPFITDPHWSEEVVLTADEYTAFMSNISKVYLEIFAVGFNGTVYYDDVSVDGTIVLNDFNTAQKLNVEQGNLVAVEVVGGGN